MEESWGQKGKIFFGVGEFCLSYLLQCQFENLIGLKHEFVD